MFFLNIILCRQHKNEKKIKALRIFYISEQAKRANKTQKELFRIMLLIFAYHKEMKKYKRVHSKVTRHLKQSSVKKPKQVCHTLQYS